MVIKLAFYQTYTNTMRVFQLLAVNLYHNMPYRYLLKYYLKQLRPDCKMCYIYYTYQVTKICYYKTIPILQGDWIPIKLYV